MAGMINWILLDNRMIVYDVERDQFVPSDQIMDDTYFHPNYSLTIDHNSGHITNKTTNLAEANGDCRYSWSTFRDGCILGPEIYLCDNNKIILEDKFHLYRYQTIQHHGSFFVIWNEDELYFKRFVKNPWDDVDLFYISWNQNRLVCQSSWVRSNNAIELIWFDLFANGTIVILLKYKKKSFLATIDLEGRFRYKACNAEKCFCIDRKLVLVFNTHLTIYQ